MSGRFDEHGNAIVGNVAIPASMVDAFRELLTRGKTIHYCDDGLPKGRVPCDCSTGEHHNLADCRDCSRPAS